MAGCINTCLRFSKIFLSMFIWAEEWSFLDTYKYTYKNCVKNVPTVFFKELPFSADSPSPRYITTVSNTITITNTLTLLLQKWICSFHRASFQKLARSLDGGDACFQIFVKRNREIYERREKPWSRLSWKVHNGNNLSVSGCPYQACLMWGVNRLKYRHR